MLRLFLGIILSVFSEITALADSRRKADEIGIFLPDPVPGAGYTDFYDLDTGRIKVYNYMI